MQPGPAFIRVLLEQRSPQGQCRDPRAEVILDTAYTLLQERATKLADEDLQRSFLEKVPSHRELVAAWVEGTGGSEIA